MQVNVTNFKAKCLRYIDSVQRGGDIVVITRNGKPAAKLVPIDQGPDQPWFGRAAGSVREKGPIYGADESWDADS